MRSRIAPAALVALLVVGGCGDDTTPQSFQGYRLGATRQQLQRTMAKARAFGSGERLLYDLVTDFPDGPEVSHWADEARVQSGDSVTVLSTFYRDHLARIDVVYPAKVALRDGCPLCAALRQAHGPPSEESMSTLGPSMRWSRWPCCELRLAHAGLAVAVSYVDRRIAAARVEAAQRAEAREGEGLLR